MAVDTYMVFYPNAGNALTSESQLNFKDPTKVDPFPASGAPLTNSSFFEILDWSTDVEQTLNIGSQSAGAGAGKITFNPFSVSRRVDIVSPTLFAMCAAGTPFKFVDLMVQKAGQEGAARQTFLAYRFGLTAVKTIGWSSSEEAPQETVSFEYGSIIIGYASPQPNGNLNKMVFRGWDRVRNVPIG